MITDCYNALDTYGKSPEALSSTVALFLLKLKDYAWPQILTAFEEYLENNTSMPKPADIICLIDPSKKERKFCAVYYAELLKRKRNCDILLDAELAYISDYEKKQRGE